MAEEVSLQELFQRGLEGQRKVEGGELSSGSEEFKVKVLVLNLTVNNLPSPCMCAQLCVSSAISSLESATRMVNQLSLFSSNEEIDEVATTDLK